MPSTQLVLPAVSQKKLRITHIIQNLPYGNDDTAQPESGALHLEGLVLLEGRSGKILTHTRNVQTNLCSKMYC